MYYAVQQQVRNKFNLLLTLRWKTKNAVSYSTTELRESLHAGNCLVSDFNRTQAQKKTL